MTHSLPDFRSPDFLEAHIRRTLAFYAGRNLDPTGGFFHFFKDNGEVYDQRGRHLVSSTRFVFNHAMAYRRFGADTDLSATRHGLDFLHTAHAQPQGGYAWRIDWHEGRSTVVDGTQHCYGLAFVLLAHAHALMAGLEEAREGLASTVRLMDEHFWEEGEHLFADEATPDWRTTPYRGQNANMHACEAFMAAWDATGDVRHLLRARDLAEAVTQRLADRAAGQDGPLVWEHYHPDWSIDWDYNRDDRTNIFRPWGFQTGHLTELSKLLLQLSAHWRRSALSDADEPSWLLPTAQRFFDVALRRGWDAQHGGLVYGFAPDGAVCDNDKYFWVQAESLAAAALLAVHTGQSRYWDDYERLWRYAWAHMIDHTHGAWYRIRTADNLAYSDEKSPAGKTDYHTMGACYDILRALGR